VVKLDSRDLEAMDDAQRVALLEMLVTGVMADGKVTAEELARFDEIVVDLPWGLDRPVLDALIRGTQQRVASLKTPDAVSDFIIGLAGRVPSASLRDKLVFTMMSVMSADHEVDRREKNVLGMFVLAFGITSERLSAIKLALAAHHARSAGAPSGGGEPPPACA
jgi:uncharacterized tellurite resistance protein B-like protein